MNKRYEQFGYRASGTAALVCLALNAFGSVRAKHQHYIHKFYVETNAAANNQILIYGQNSDGSLTFLESVATGGSGNGGGLGQGAIAFGNQGASLYAVNAGSNTISMFRVEDGGLTLLANQPSGGLAPISVTAYDNVAYVLNSGGVANLAGFRWTGHSGLQMIPSSTRTLSANAPVPEQVGFNRNGTQLVVTEKVTNKIDVFSVDDSGILNSRKIYNSAGPTPFGFDFGRDNTLFVSEANGGLKNLSSASTYHLSQSVSLTPVSAVIPTLESAACWAVVTHDGQFGYTANAGSGTLTGFSIEDSGVLGRITANGITATTDPHPVDMAVSTNDRYLYVVSNNGGAIDEFQIGRDGSLSVIGSVTGLPISISGAVTN